MVIGDSVGARLNHGRNVQPEATAGCFGDFLANGVIPDPSSAAGKTLKLPCELTVYLEIPIPPHVPVDLSQLVDVVIADLEFGEAGRHLDRPGPGRLGVMDCSKNRLLHLANSRCGRSRSCQCGCSRRCRRGCSRRCRRGCSRRSREIRHLDPIEANPPVFEPIL